MKKDRYDVVIPFHKKHLVTINFCLDGCLKYLQPKNIYIITSLKNKPIFSKYKKITVIDENLFFKNLSLIKFFMYWFWKNPRYLHKTPRWIYQQFIKMASSYKIKNITPNYLILDSDTVFLKKTAMLSGHKSLICQASEYHYPYFIILKKLLNFIPHRQYSFISHHQMVNKKIMIIMLKRMCDRNLKNWQEKWCWQILRQYDYRQKNGFSEYETYGHFIKKFYPNIFRIRPLRWQLIKADPTPKMITVLAKTYDFVSFRPPQRSNF